MAQRHPRSAPRKQESHDADDAFVAGVLEASTWAKHNQSKLTFGGIALAALLLVGWYWVNYTRSHENRALEQLEQIQQTISIGDVETSKVSLAQFVEQFGGTSVAGEASLILAQLYLDTDQAGQALQALSDSGVGLNDPLGPQIWTLRGRALESQNQFEQAEEIYMEVAESAELPFQRTEALGDAARIRALNGDAAGAIALYDELLSDLTPSDPARGEYEMRKAELEAAQIG